MEIPTHMFNWPFDLLLNERGNAAALRMTGPQTSQPFLHHAHIDPR